MDEYAGDFALGGEGGTSFINSKSEARNPKQIQIRPVEAPGRTWTASKLKCSKLIVAVVNRETDFPWSGARIIPVHVRRNIKLAEAPSYGKTIFEYEPRCNGAEDYKTVAEYIHSQTGAGSISEPEPVVVGKDESVGDAAKKV